MLSSCNQAALLMFLSICPSLFLSVILPVCHTFLVIFLLSKHHEILEVFSDDRSDFHAKGQGQRSKVKFNVVKKNWPRFGHFRTVVRRWLWNYTQSMKCHIRDALFFSKVTRQIWRSHGTKICQFYAKWVFPDCYSFFNSPVASKLCKKLEVA